MNNIVIDLHSHSTISDGILSPTELVNHAHTKKSQSSSFDRP